MRYEFRSGEAFLFGTYSSHVATVPNKDPANAPQSSSKRKFS